MYALAVILFAVFLLMLSARAEHRSDSIAECTDLVPEETNGFRECIRNRVEP